MSALLEGPAETRVKFFEPLQVGERLGNFLQVALRNRDHVQDVAVFRNRGSQAFPRAQRCRVLILLEKRADAQNLRFDGRGNGRCGCDLHHRDKKAGLKPAIDSTASVC